MMLENHIRDDDDIVMILKTLSQKVTELPEEYREALQLELLRLDNCMQDLLQGRALITEQHVESESKLQAIFQNAPFSMVLTRLADGTVVDANPAFLNIFGFQREEIIGQTSLNLGVLEDVERREQAMALLREQGFLRGVELAYHTRAGAPLVVRFNADIITIQGERYMLSTAEDITERKQIEEQLAYHASLLDSVHDAVIATDAEQRITAWNKTAESLYGFTAQEALGQAASQLLRAELTEAQRAEIFQQARNNRSTVEALVQTKSGQRILVESINIPRFDHHGKVTGYVSVSRDITERKRAEEALRRSEERFSRAFRSSPSGQVITRLSDGHIIDANDSFLSLVGFTREEVLGRTSTELGFHPSPEARAEVLRAMEETGRVRNFEIAFPIKSGAVVSVLYSLETVEINGEACLLSTFLDITELRHLEAEQIEAAAEMEVQRRLMEQREQERQSIARDIHDGPIQTLSSTSFHLKLIKETFTDPKLQVELNQVGLSIRRTVQELRDVMNDLRPPALIHFGLSRAIQLYTADFCDQHPEIVVQVNVMDDERQLADQTRLALFRVYQEGLSNIIRHAGATKAEIIYRIDGDTFLLELRDNGKGFVVSKDFARLLREGHYGLAGMKERAEAVGASFVVTSAPGQGTVITIRGALADQPDEGEEANSPDVPR